MKRLVLFAALLLCMSLDIMAQSKDADIQEEGVRSRTITELRKE